MYDLAGPWALMNRDGLINRLVVINNSGGKIFQRIFRNSLFENRHDLEFSSWAAMWRLGYSRWENVPEGSLGDLNLSESMSQTHVIEIVPNDEATRRFWDRYDNLW
jgi:2-succinyl-5-enolpyruvyl-6-hydroxy-3-cyclohexene-1-carboxylate synthase